MNTYIIYDGKYYKIGKAKNLKARFSSIKTDNPDVELLYYYEGNIEKDLHEKYKDKRYKGEWFKLEEEDLKEIGEYFTKYLKSERKKKDKHKEKFLKNMRYRIKHLADSIDKSSTIENIVCEIPYINTTGFYKVEVLEGCHFIIFEEDSKKAVLRLKRELSLLSTALIKSCVLIENLEEVFVEYCYQKNNFFNTTLDEIVDVLEFGIICDDFVDFGYIPEIN